MLAMLPTDVGSQDSRNYHAITCTSANILIVAFCRPVVTLSFLNHASFLAELRSPNAGSYYHCRNSLRIRLLSNIKCYFVSKCRLLARYVSTNIGWSHVTSSFQTDDLTYISDIQHWASSSEQLSQCSVEPGTAEDVATVVRP